MKNLEQIQAQLADISDIIAAMQQEQLQQHRDKLKQSSKDSDIYQFDEKGLRAFIEQIVEEATSNIVAAINNDELALDTEDVVDLDLEGNCIDVTIDQSYIAQAIEDYASDEEVVDVEQAIKDAKQYHTIKL
jgi:hypothetical protein